MLSWLVIAQAASLLVCSEVEAVAHTLYAYYVAVLVSFFC